MDDLDLTFSFCAFKSRMDELETLGLAYSTQIDSLKKHYFISSKGKKIVSLLLDFFDSYAYLTHMIND